MFELPGFAAREKPAPGRVADWSVAIFPLDPAIDASLARTRIFADADGLAGMALGALGGAKPPLITFDRAGHFARVEVDAQIGLSGGGFSLVLNTARAGDFDRLSKAKAACDEKRVPLVAEVSLGWSSNRGFLGLLGPSGAGLEFAGAFAVTDITPSVEGVVYRIALHGRELFSHRLSQARVTDTPLADTPEQAVEALLKHLNFAPDSYVIDKDTPQEPPDPAPPPIMLALGSDGLAEAERLGMMIEALRRRQGRKPFLIRDRRLHIGVARAIPFKPAAGPGKVLRLSAASGLIGTTETRSEPRDPKFDYARAYKAGNLHAVPAMRRNFRLELVGAPEIRPGDVVAFPPPQDSAAAAPLSALMPEDWSAAIEMYVATVSHRIDINAGFMTTLTGAQVETAGAPADLWDVPSDAPLRTSLSRPKSLDDGTAEGALAASVARQIDRALSRQTLAEVAEVTGTVPASGADPKLLPLSSNLLVGVSDGGAIARRSATNPIFRQGQSATPGVPYATPFAWGPYGLVLPRYPGTRVMLLAGHGDAEDQVDIGALWHGPASDTAARPGKTRDGDWWLKLPARIAPAEAADVIEDPVLPDADALATNDLTDARGSRIIEVGQLVIRVGDAALHKATDRPALDGVADAAIVIEQKDGGAIITIDKDGKVTIKAKNVAVEVSGTMDVTKGTA